MSEDDKKFNLEERTFRFALAVRRLIGSHVWTREQRADVEQLLPSSGSVAANYTEANNAISSADFSRRLKISRKESGESRLWLRLLGETSDDERKPLIRDLYREADELVPIFSSILRKLGG